MTAQINDSFLLEDKNFSVVGVNGAGLFDPYAHNMNPMPRITSCWRGYVCTYKTLHNKLLLDTLQSIWSGSPAISDVRPQFDPKSTFDNVYKDSTCTPTLAEGCSSHEFIQRLYVHMGFHPA
jgi:hypothetical protein